MISSRQDLKDYIRADFERQNMTHPFLASITFGEHALVRRYLEVLRHLEYWKNCGRIPFGKALYSYYKLKHRRLSLKTGLFIAPNTTGKGLLLPHPGFIRVDTHVIIGDSCTILPMVLLGKKSPDVEDATTIIGDNCYISTGVTILGPVKIGSNVTIGAGAVVTKDIPDNAVVGGVPAKILKNKEPQ